MQRLMAELGQFSDLLNIKTQGLQKVRQQG